MAEKNPLVTLEEAYWWLNNADAPYLRPPLHELLAHFSEGEKANDPQALDLVCQQFIDSQLNFLRPPVKAMVEKLHHAVKAWVARDIESARKRLNESGGSFLRNPNYAYVMIMRQAVSQKPADAWVPLERLYSTCAQITDDLEAGETLVECGFALYQLHNPQRALQLFKEANQRYTSYTQQIAVVYWMIGVLHWELGQHHEALAAWRKSVSRFEKLASQRITQTAADTKWYRDILKKVNASMGYAVEHEKSPQKPAAAPTGTETQAAASPEAQPAEAQKAAARPGSPQAASPEDIDTESVAGLPEAQPIFTFTGDLLEALPVLAEIPAGPWKQTRGDRNIIGQVTINQVWINNEPHFVKNLRGGHIISLAAIEKHVVIKIIGNSMNAAQPTPIEDGDYVLLRRQNTAQAGDIVVAKILDQTTRGPMTTIKRFLIDGHPLLKAESTDPQFGQLNDEFKIDGLAVAVFKPVNKTEL